MRGLLSDSSYKLQFAGHETFPLRQLWLRKAYDAVSSHGDVAPKSIFANTEAIIQFGVGKNMVSAIRHWGLACKVIQEMKGGYAIGPIGNALFGEAALDTYLEKLASAWLIHWVLAGEGHRATTWYYLFNCLPAQTFDKGLILNGLQSYLSSRDSVVAENTLGRDIEVCLRSYVPRDPSGKSVLEECAEPVLSQLGLIAANRTSYDFRIGPKPSLPDGVFLYALTSFWQQYANSANTLAFDLIAVERGSPGLVFKLDVDSVAERLVDIESTSRGVYAWSDTAGMQQVVRIKNVEPEYFLPLAYKRSR